MTHRTAEVTALQAQQQALVSALFPPLKNGALVCADLSALMDTTGAQYQRGFMAYQANGNALAERSLHAAFPVIAQLIGHASFNPLARDFWHCYPPQRGDLAQWGEALPSFLASNPQLTDAPYLTDVARVEWALHRAAFAADAQPDQASFARLAQEDPETLTLTLSPGLCTVTSRYSVASVVMAHLYGKPTLMQAGARLRQGQGETALVWRQGLRPRVVSCSAVVALLIEHTQAHHNLSSALEASLSHASAESIHFDFSTWLSDAVTRGLVIGVHTALPATAEDHWQPEEQTAT